MAKKIRLTQEEQIERFLKKQGFQQIPEKDIKKEPYKTIYKKPECFKNNKT